MPRISPARLNHLATAAAIPLMVLGIMMASRFSESAGEPSSASDFPGEGLLVVANLQSQSLTIYDFAVDRDPRTLALPGPPHEIAVLDRRLYVTLGRAGLVVEVDPYAPAILRTVSLAGHPHGIAIDSAGIHVTLDDANEVVHLDWPTLEETGRTPTGDTPHVIAASRGALFVTDSRDGRLRKIDGGTVETVPAGELPEAIAAIGGTVITGDADGGALHAFDADTLALRATVALPGRPVRIAGVGSSLLVARNHAATLSVLSAETLEPLAEVPVGPFPDGICASPSGRFVAVPSNGGGLVTIVDTATWSARGVLPAGGGPGACAWLPAD